jgi:hypothetical protein
MTKCKRVRATLTSASVVVLHLAFASRPPAHAQPSADQALTDMGVSAADRQRVLNGEFVTADATAVSERDLSASIAFVVKTSPDSLAKQIVAGDLIRTDPQVQAHGQFNGAGSLADLAGLQIGAAAAQKLSHAEAGEKLNLGTSEIAAFNALQGATQQATQEQLRQMLFARFQAYQTSGLAGIVPYDRGGGKATDVGLELRKASAAAVGLKKYLPTFQQVLVGYPEATSPGMQQTFHWLKYNIDGVETYVLTHTLVAADGAARAVAQRQFYVSTGYNAEQAVAGFLPVQEGTVVAYTNHTFTDQVAGMGGSVKRNIGRRMMANKLKQIFDRARGGVTQ